MRKIWPFSFYFLFFAAASALVPYMALYYRQIGLSGAEIGILTGLAPLISLVGAPLLTGFADAQHRHRLIIGLTLGGVMFSVLLIPFTEQFTLLFLLVAIYAFIGSPIVSLADSATVSMLGEQRALYGRIRTGGTIGWGLAAPLAGLVIQNNGLRWAFWLYAAGMFAALLVSQGLHFGPVSVQQPFRSGFKILMSNRRWLLFLAMVFMAGMGMATVTTYLFPFMEQVGASRGLMGLSQTIATLAELPFLFFANRLIKHYGARGLLVLSMAVVGVRLLLYAAFPTLAAILLIQLLHGLTFATIWVAGVSYAHDHAPAGLEATAQGVFGSTMMGVGAAAGNFFGALLMEAVGGQQMYFLMGLIVLLGLGFFLLVEKRFSTPSVQYETF